MTTVTAVASPKGGVGKTTLALNVAHALARRGNAILLVDADPQGCIGWSLSPEVSLRPGLAELLRDELPLADALVTTRVRELAILPAGHGLAEIAPARLARFLLAERGDGRHLLIDTAPGLSGQTAAILSAADFLVSPIQAEPLAARVLVQMLEHLATLHAAGGRLRLAALVPMMVQTRQSVSLAVLQEIFQRFPAGTVLESFVPRDPIFLEASAQGVPLALLSRRPPAVSAVFDQIAMELERRLGLVNEEDEHAPLSLLD